MSFIKIQINSFIVVALIITALSGCALIPASKSWRSIELSGLNGTNHRLGEYQSKINVLVVWASWCPVCLSELNQLEKFYRQYKNSGLSIIAVSTDDYRADILSRVPHNSFSFPILIDSYKILSRKYSHRTIPYTLIFDANDQLILQTDNPKVALNKIKELAQGLL